MNEFGKATTGTECFASALRREPELLGQAVAAAIKSGLLEVPDTDTHPGVSAAELVERWSTQENE